MLLHKPDKKMAGITKMHLTRNSNVLGQPSIHPSQSFSLHFPPNCHSGTEEVTISFHVVPILALWKSLVSIDILQWLSIVFKEF